MDGVWRPFSEPEYKRPWQIIRLIKQIGRDIKWSHQRIWKGYCDYDLFSIDYWFMKIMPKMLKVFKETRHGSPVAVNYHSHAVFLDEEERNQDVHDEWDKKLDRMIFLLEEMNEESCTQQNPYEDEYFEAIDKLREGPTEHPDGSVSYRYPHLKEYPEYRELAEEYDAEEKRITQYRLDCKQEFFDLFSTYFYDLWD